MSWAQLQAIVEEMKQASADEKARPLITCPICSETLDRNSKGEANCPLGHFRTTAKTHGELGGTP